MRQGSTTIHSGIRTPCVHGHGDAGDMVMGMILTTQGYELPYLVFCLCTLTCRPCKVSRTVAAREGTRVFDGSLRATPPLTVGDVKDNQFSGLRPNRESAADSTT